MAAPPFYRGPYAVAVFTMLRVVICVTGALFLVLAVMALSDAILGTRFGYEISDGLWGLLAVACCAFGWKFIGMIQNRLSDAPRGNGTPELPISQLLRDRSERSPRL